MLSLKMLDCRLLPAGSYSLRIRDGEDGRTASDNHPCYSIYFRPTDARLQPRKSRCDAKKIMRQRRASASIHSDRPIRAKQSCLAPAWAVRYNSRPVCRFAPQAAGATRRRISMTATGQAGSTLTSLDALREKARILRIHSLRMTTAAGSGHPTSCLSAAELVAATFFHAMQFDPADPNALAGDRFVLSKGHAAPILYAALAESGVFPVSRLDDAAAIFERTRRPSDTAHSRRGCRHRLAGPGAFGGRGSGAGRAHAEIARARFRADGRWRNGRRQRVGSSGVRRALRARQSRSRSATSTGWARASAPCIGHDTGVYQRKFESEGWAAEVVDGHDIAAVVAALDQARATRGKPYRRDRAHRKRPRHQFPGR